MSYENNFNNEENGSKEEIKHARKKQSNNLIFPYTLIFLLIGVSIWFYFDMKNIKEELSILQIDLANTQNDVSTIAAAMISLESELSIVGALARNANMYAHSHNTWSDEALKTKITPIENSLVKILSLQGIYFQWDLDAQKELGLSDESQIGLIAQDVERVFPELVHTDPSGFKTIDYAKLTSVLIEAIKEQQAEIIKLRDQIDQ